MVVVRQRGGGGGKLTTRSGSKNNDATISNGCSSTGQKNNDTAYVIFPTGNVLLLLVVVATLAVAILISSSSSSSRGEVSIATDDKSDHDVVDEKTSRPPIVQQQTRFGRYMLLERVPHDAHAFTQGLEMMNATHYYESLGLYGESSVRIVDLMTGKSVRETTPVLEHTWFGEGLTRYSSIDVQDDGQEQQQHRLIQITWMEKVAFIYDADTLQELQRIPYDTSTGQGWGIAYAAAAAAGADDDKRRNCLYFTDGSNLLHTFHVPTDVVDHDEQQDASTTTITTSMTESRPRVEVYMTRDENSIPIHNLNELEYDDDSGTLLANVWHENVIVRIDPDTGFVQTIYNLQELYPQDERPTSADVLNGIALVRHKNAADANVGSSEVWVTGKKWPWMYRIRLLDE